MKSFLTAIPPQRPAATSTRTEKGEALSSLFGPTLYLEKWKPGSSTPPQIMIGCKDANVKEHSLLFSSCNSHLRVAACATTAHNLTCLHLIRRKIDGRNFWLRSLQEKNSLRFLGDTILRSNSDGLMLI